VNACEVCECCICDGVSVAARHVKRVNACEVRECCVSDGVLGAAPYVKRVNACEVIYSASVNVFGVKSLLLNTTKLNAHSLIYLN